MVAQIQNFKLQMQHHAVPVSDLSLYKITSHNIFLSSNLDPDIYPFQGITRVFSKTIYERNQTMYNYMVAQIQNFRLQMQPQAVPVSDLSISKVTSQKIFVSADMDPDLDPVQAIARVFSKTFKFFTPLCCDIEPEITKPTSRKIVVSYNLYPYPSANLFSRNIVFSSDLAHNPSSSLDSKRLSAQGFRGPFLLNSSCLDFEKVDEGRKLSSQLWVRMAGY